MNKLRFLTSLTMGLTLAGISAISFASIAQSCESFYSMPNIEFMQVAGSASTADTLGQCVQQNICGELYSSPTDIAQCSTVLNNRNFISKYQYNYDIISQQSGASQSSYGQSYNPGNQAGNNANPGATNTSADSNYSANQNSASQSSADQANANANANNSANTYVPPIDPTSPKSDSQSSSDSNSIHWF